MNREGFVTLFDLLLVGKKKKITQNLVFAKIWGFYEEFLKHFIGNSGKNCNKMKRKGNF